MTESKTTEPIDIMAIASKILHYVKQQLQWSGAMNLHNDYEGLTERNYQQWMLIRDLAESDMAAVNRVAFQIAQEGNNIHD